MTNIINVTSPNKYPNRLRNQLKKVAFLLFSFLKKDELCLDIYLVENRRMRNLNRIYRKKNKATNVLAIEAPNNFPAIKEDKKNLGEIYLNIPYIRKNEEDINYLLLHAILHLIGFNHKTKSDRIKMEKLEQETMKWLNTKF
jgi:probable rRNA maturation factor